MKILHVASEAFPLIKTGGLADVIGALPWALQSKNVEVRLLLPYYPQVRAMIGDTDIVAQLQTFGGAATLRYAVYRGLGVYLLDAPQFFARDGNPYHDENYRDYHDNAIRFALLSFMAAAIANGLDSWWQRAAILHAHDWQTGLACAYLKYWNAPVKSVFTIHNLAYQGIFAAHHLPQIELPATMFALEGLEFHGQISYLKAGIYYSDNITAVSPSYALEITEEDKGYGLHGLLRHRQAHLSGILNGIDAQIWNPSRDTHLPCRYSAATLPRKKDNKIALQKMLQLDVDAKKLLVVMVARLNSQKGADLLLGASAKILQLPLQLAILGSGDPHLEDALRALAAHYPHQVAVKLRYDEQLAHQLLGGGDVILLPSRFEPCGLTQLYGLKYGTLPLVRRCGGLADTVTDSNATTLRLNTASGFVFENANGDELHDCLQRACQLWQRQDQWQKVCRHAMSLDYSWRKSAQNYLALYENLWRS